MSNSEKLRMLLVIIVIFSHLSATNGEAVSCSTNVVEDDQAAEGDSVTYSCYTTYSGIYNASLVWYQLNGKQWLRVCDIPVPTRGHLINTCTGIATVPKTSSLTCALCEAIPGKGVCTWTDANSCATEEYDVLYSVRSIKTWPILYASPGEELTCEAEGNPDPEYLWVKKENDGEWVSAGENDNGEDTGNEDGDKVTAVLSENSTSAIYKCIAANTIRFRLYTIESAGIEVTAGGAKKRWIILGSVLGGVAVIAIIGVIVYFVMR